LLEAWHGHLGTAADERVADVKFTKDTLSVAMKDGRTISVPLVWYPRLLNATTAQRKNWRIAGAGYGIHWPDVDEDLSTEGSFAAHRRRGQPGSKVNKRRNAEPPAESNRAFLLAFHPLGRGWRRPSCRAQAVTKPRCTPVALRSPGLRDRVTILGR